MERESAASGNRPELLDEVGLARERGRSWNPLEWSALDRCLLWFAIVGPWPFVVWLLTRHALRRPGFFTRHTPFIDVGYVRDVIDPFFFVFYVTGASVLISILAVRRRAPENRALVHATVQLYSIYSALVIHFTGTITSAFWSIFATGMVLLFILFDTVPVLLAMASAFVITVVSLIASQAGWMRYAPVFATSPFADSAYQGSPASAFVMIGLLWTVTLLFCAVFLVVIVRWRERETQVVELSVFLRDMFGRYLPRDVMRTLLRDPASLRLGGEKRRVTLMMTDLRGFTAMSEKLDPQAVVAMVNSYFRVMMGICDRYGGTVNDIEGDGLLVTFGAPAELSGHARQAIACAIEMQNAMAALNEENERHGRPHLEMGIALNTAEVVVGNIGCEEHAKFGVIGSGVNLTARIETYTLGGQILASQSVLDEAGEVVRVDDRRTVHPKGAAGPLVIHEIGGIGSTYQLALERAEPPLVRLPVPLAARCALVDGKQDRDESATARIEALSLRELSLCVPRPLARDDNVRLQLVGAGSYIEHLSFYGKVVSTDDGSASRIRLTYAPPEVATYFQGLLDAGRAKRAPAGN